MMTVLLYSSDEIMQLAERDELLKKREEAGFVEEFGLCLSNSRELRDTHPLPRLASLRCGCSTDVDFESRANRYGDVLTIEGPPQPKANFTYKLKIALSFAQIITNLAVG